MSYMVDIGHRTRLRFATENEASAFANDVAKATKYILGVFEDKKHKANMRYQFQDLEIAGKTYKKGAYYL